MKDNNKNKITLCESIVSPLMIYMNVEKSQIIKKEGPDHKILPLLHTKNL